jgi:hypothetical protein
MQAKPNNRLMFSPPQDVHLSQKKKMFPERDLHHLHHKAVFTDKMSSFA